MSHGLDTPQQMPSAHLILLVELLAQQAAREAVVASQDRQEHQQIATQTPKE